MSFPRSNPRPTLQLLATATLTLLFALTALFLGAPQAGGAAKSAPRVELRKKTRGHSTSIQQKQRAAKQQGSRGPNFGPSAPQPTRAPAPESASSPKRSPKPAPAPFPTPAPQPPSAPAPVPAPGPQPAALLSSGFEEGLRGWNLAGVGEVIPTVISDPVHSGSKACRMRLSGSEHRSELIFGGNGSWDSDGSPQFREGEEYWYGFSFRIEKMVWGRPGAHNLIMQFKSEGTGSPSFGLDLWDYAGDDGRSGGKGLWTEGRAMGGNRFLAPLTEHVWHEIAIHFKASSQNQGFYEVFLNGKLVDARTNISMIVPGRGYGYIKNGLYRNGETAPGTSELLLDDSALGTSHSAVTAG